MPRRLPNAVYSVIPKHGDNDCAIACMAFVFRRDYGEVLAAAARVSKTVWASGLSCLEMIRVARALKAKAIATQTFDPDEDIGVLWVSFRDNTKEHVVVLKEGWVFDPDHNPVSLWRYDEFLSAMNAVPKMLLKEMSA